MNAHRHEATIYVRYIHEMLFSWNLAAAYVLLRLMTWKSNAFADLIFMRIKYGTNALFHLQYNNTFGAWVAIWAVAILLGLPPFLVLRIFARAAAVKVVLRTVAGMTALALWPAWWFDNWGQAYAMSWRIRGLIEVEAAVICALLYLRGIWPLPAWASLLLLAGHAGIWCWYYYTWLQDLPTIVPPLVGFASSLAWGLYVSDERGH